MPQDIGGKLCASPEDGGPAFRDAFEAGGARAQAAVAALLSGTCPKSSAVEDAFGEFQGSSELKDPKKVMG